MRNAICVPVFLALLSAGCGLTGPSESLAGHWIARIQTAGFAVSIGMTLQQTGDDITGTACTASNGQVGYSGVAVTGEYPNVQFTAVTPPPGVSFRGRQDSTEDIVGTYGTVDIRFQRSATSVCP
jgi:hypothetical protein